jgi:hypothetical protein
MIKIGLFSEDDALRLLLSSALGRQFVVKRESSEKAMFDLISSGGCDVMILDGVSNPELLPQKAESFGRLIAQPVPSVILGDGARRTSALGPAQAGAFVIDTDLLQLATSTL